jgi:hypothetical protein
MTSSTTFIQGDQKVSVYLVIVIRCTETFWSPCIFDMCCPLILKASVRNYLLLFLFPSEYIALLYTVWDIYFFCAPCIVIVIIRCTENFWSPCILDVCCPRILGAIVRKCLLLFVYFTRSTLLCCIQCSIYTLCVVCVGRAIWIRAWFHFPLSLFFFTPICSTTFFCFVRKGFLWPWRR